MTPGDILPNTNGAPDVEPNAAFDYLEAIGMPAEFVEATSGDFLGRLAVEPVDAAAGDTLVSPFGDEFFVAPSSIEPKNATKNRPHIATPARLVKTSYDGAGNITDTEYSSPD